MLTTIHLHGRLGKKFGKVFQLDILTPAEAIRALCFICKGFEEHLRKSDSEGFGYRFLAGRREMAEPDLQAVQNQKEFHLFPIPLVAAKKGVVQIILGVVLIAAAFVSAGATMSAVFSPGGWATLFTGGVGTGAQMTAMFGASMIFGGIAQLIANPKLAKFDAGTDERSYIFNGSAMTTRQGGPVPVGYGRLHIGPQIISLGITTSNEKQGSVGDNDTEWSDDESGDATYGADGTEVVYARPEGTADWVGGIDHLGQPLVPTKPDALPLI